MNRLPRTIEPGCVVRITSPEVLRETGIASGVVIRTDQSLADFAREAERKFGPDAAKPWQLDGGEQIFWPIVQAHPCPAVPTGSLCFAIAPHLMEVTAWPAWAGEVVDSRN